MTETASDIWYPIASATDLPYRHVFHGQLAGRELAVWRADDDNINVWENRCLHRGVRLSIGINDGAELKCQYHGWRYANRSAGCTYIPAHPADAPARRITNRTYPAIERFGLIWSAAVDAAPFTDPLPAGDWIALRPVPVNATPEAVYHALLAAAQPGTPVEQLPGAGMSLILVGTDGHRVTAFVQPVDSARAVIRALLPATPVDKLVTTRLYNAVLTHLRDAVETAASQQPAPEPIEPSYEPVSVELASMPDISVGRRGQLRVQVARKWSEATDVIGLELTPLTGTLPAFQPGAHIDLHLPNGLIRQYSITNGPGEWSSYAVGVKRDLTSRGGSSSIADTLREGDVLAISEPRNNFPLRRDALRTVLVAGGIGITPLLSMAKALHKSGLPFEFHVFARSHDHLAYRDALKALGNSVILHLGLTPDETRTAVAAALGDYAFAHHLYCCGPGPMIEMIGAQAEAQGWPEDAVHFEYFSNSKPINDSSSFTVELARSAMTLQIPAGKSILQVMRENGIDAPSSCEQGACGTCMTGVIDGIPDHQDVYLNRGEKRANTCMMTCVSRALSPRLVLDI